MENRHIIRCEKYFDGEKLSEHTTVTIGNGTVPCEHSVYCLTPGLIDNHIHGGMGYFSLEATPEDTLRWLEDLANHGICGVVLTAYGTTEQIRTVLKNTDTVMKLQKKRKIGALLLGVHLEGPFLSSEYPGSMPSGSITDPSVEEYKKLTDGFEHTVREVTLAPERENCVPLIKYLLKRNIRVLAGHTACSSQTAEMAFENGVGAVCHTFNACHPIHHRDPGIVTAALVNDGVYCEYIGDLVHLNRDTIRLILHCKTPSKAILISDAVSTTGLPDGDYREGNTDIRVSGGESRVADTNSLNGGGCYISESVGRLIRAGIPPEEILPTATSTPKKWIDPENTLPRMFTAWDERFSPLFCIIGDEFYRCGK